MQITTSLQQAVATVHQYPRTPNPKVLLELLAQRFKEPSIESLAGPLDVDDLQQAAKWQTVIQYVESLDASSVHGYAPLIRTTEQVDKAGA